MRSTGRQMFGVKVKTFPCLDAINYTEPSKIMAKEHGLNFK